MKGKVVMVNPRNGCFAVRREDGDFVLCREIGQFTIMIDDEVSGDLDALGKVTLDNLTSRKPIRAFMQETYTSSMKALESLD